MFGACGLSMFVNGVPCLFWLWVYSCSMFYVCSVGAYGSKSFLGVRVFVSERCDIV